MESLTGDSEIEVAATGGIDEALYIKLATLPVPLQWTPRLEGYAEVGAGLGRALGAYLAENPRRK